MSGNNLVSIDDIRAAKKRIEHDLPPTLMRHGWALAKPGFNVYYKCENLFFTGNFKERGALNAFLMLNEEQRRKGIVAASAGNHAQACAYHGGKLGIPVTVVMPTNSPIVKVNNCRTLKAEVILHGKDMSEAKAYAMDLCKQKGRRYINGFNDLEIIAGAGTIGLEILDQLPNVDAVIVPVGGGSMLSGVSTAIKALRPSVQVIGVESERCASMCSSYELGVPQLTPVDAKGTIADGLAVPLVGDNSAKIIKNNGAKVISVSESYIYRAVLHLLEKEKILAEGAGATSLAGICSGKLDHLKGKTICVVVSGGNIDTNVLGRVVERGLYLSGRLMALECIVKDKIGGIADFCTAIANAGASIKEISSTHLFTSDVGIGKVEVVLETLSYDHCSDILKKLKAAGYEIKLSKKLSIKLNSTCKDSKI